MSAHDLDLTPRPSEGRRAHWTYERRASDPVVLPTRRSRRGAALAAVLGIGVGLGIVALWGTQIDGPEPMLSETAPVESRSPDHSTTHYEQVLSHRALMEARMTLGSTMMDGEALAQSDSATLSADGIDPNDAVPTSGTDLETMRTGSSDEPSRSDVLTGTPQSSVGPDPATSDNPSATEQGSATTAPPSTSNSSDNPY